MKPDIKDGRFIFWYNNQFKQMHGMTYEAFCIDLCFDLRENDEDNSDARYGKFSVLNTSRRSPNHDMWRSIPLNEWPLEARAVMLLLDLK